MQTILENSDTELALLECVYEAQQEDSSHITQRELARASGLSLGMTNALVRKLADRGWLSLTRLSPKSFRYALTPEGVNEVTRRTVGYFKRASRSASLYRDRIESLVLDAKTRGFGSLILAGSSEVDFLLEWSCERHGLVFMKCAETERAKRLAKASDSLLVWAEGREPTIGGNDVSLQDLIITP